MNYSLSEKPECKELVEMLIDEIEKDWTIDNPVLPKHISDTISLNLEYTLECIKYLKNCEWNISNNRAKILLSLIEDGLYFIRYSIDRKDKQGIELLSGITPLINETINALSQDMQIAFSQIIFNTRINIDVQLEHKAYETDRLDISPKLPTLLEKLRREKVFRNAFELYELMSPHIQLLDEISQLYLIIEIAEILGASNWHPQPLSWKDEINRLREKYAECLTDSFIEESLSRSSKWHSDNPLIRTWFETGDVAEEVIIATTQKHEKSPDVPMHHIAAEYIMEHYREKWQIILLIYCLWMRTKEVHNKCKDLFVVLHCLENNKSPAEIPLICDIAGQTICSVSMREIYKSQNISR